MITMIAAAGENNSLGKDNGDLLWHLPDDFKRFKKLTSGHPIVMGRKTFDTFPKLLPNRTHIILTRQNGFKAKGCMVVHTIEEALKTAKSAEGGDDIKIIGGGQVYQLALPYSDRIELTRVHHKFEGADAFFPVFDHSKWTLVQETFHPADERHDYSFTYQSFVKK